MKKWIFSILNIRQSESKFVFDLLLVQLFIGMSNAYISILAFTLFINKLKIEELPQAYIIIALSLWGLNVLYEKLEHRYSSLSLLKYIIAGSLVVLIFLWAGLSYGNEHAFIFILLIWSTLFYMVSGYAFWGLVSMLFNVRESKRVFSVIGAGDIPAKLVGYLSTPLLVKMFGMNSLVWMAVIFLLTGLIVYHLVIGREKWDPVRNRSKVHHHDKLQVTRKDIIGFFFKNELIFAISLLSILSYNVYLLVDYTFLSEVKFKFASIASLASFIAAFFAVGRFLAIILKLVFTSRVIEKFGLITSLFITPVILFLMCLSFFMLEETPNRNVIIFGIMAMLTEVLRSAMQEPVFFILFQPLSENLRLKGHIISKGYMLPFSLITVGLTLFLMRKWGVDITISLTIQVLLVNVMIWTLVIFLIRKAYLQTLHASIRKGIFNSDDIFIYDGRTADILLQKARTGNTPEVIYALKLLENSGYEQIDQLLEEKLKTGLKEVRLYVIERLQVRGWVNLDLLSIILDREEDPAIRSKLYELLCRQDPSFLRNESLKLETIPEVELKKIVITSLLNQREFELLLLAVNTINGFISSAAREEKLFALEIISGIRHISFRDSLENLMQDTDAEVRREALLCACRLRYSNLLPEVSRMLIRPSEKYLALKALQLYGDDLFIDLGQGKLDLISQHKEELVKVAAKMKGIHSTAFLVNQLDSTELPLEKTVHSLWIKEYQADSLSERNRLRDLLHKVLDGAYEKIRYFYEVPFFDDQHLVKRSIENEIRNDLVTVLKICTIVFRKREVNRLIELVELEKNSKIMNALEMMELLLPKTIMKKVNPLMDFVLEPGQVRNIPAPVSLNQLLSGIIFRKDIHFNPWTQAVCVISSWKNGEFRILKALAENEREDQPFIVSETKNFVLKTVH